MGDRFRVVREVGIGVRGLGSRGGRREGEPSRVSWARRLGARHRPYLLQIGRRSVLVGGVVGVRGSGSLRGSAGAVHAGVLGATSGALAAGCWVELEGGGVSSM